MLATRRCAMADEHVLILGAGINGCAIARDFAVNGIDVTLVDRADIASGATAYSSRLIHGGLRYLEFGEFDLVRESLEERNRLLRLAAHEVRPLELMIPVSRRGGGWRSAIAGFLGSKSPRLARWMSPGNTAVHAERGLWLVRTGLWMYDRYARDRSLPAHRVVPRDDPTAIAVDAAAYPWLCAYWDAQVRFPERFCIALLRDAQRAAAEHDAAFRVLTYHRAVRRDGEFELVPEFAGLAAAFPLDQSTKRCKPTLVVNATGASVDRTLQMLDVASPPLMGPTKGSHFITFHAGLVAALGCRALYAEAADGRPVFVLPLGDGVLVGTTDLPFEAPPETAVPSSDELDYLVGTVNHLLPQIALRRDDIDFYYAGVRPLPRTDAASPAGVTRRHWIAEQQVGAIPMLSVIGGKLTTCRALAESVVDRALARFGKPRIGSTRDRLLHGEPSRAATPMNSIVAQLSLAPNAIRSVEQLFGPQAATVLEEAAAIMPLAEPLPDAALPVAVAAWSIEHEHVRKLADLVERRLMLLYERTLSRACLARLADLLVERGRLSAQRRDADVAATIERLRSHFGKRVVGD
jgi:glycerol-3-phosphate dehydrogenase